MVKPILKKLSQSEKNSLDLDRPWEEQQVPGLAGLVTDYEPGGPARSARDVSFSFADSTAFTSKPRFQHGRSHSGTSHASVATTASGGGGGGGGGTGGGSARPSVFVHPFQVTPRSQTPPLANANSVPSLDTNAGSAGGALHRAPGGSNSIRDYSPTITENEDDDDYPVGSLPTHRYHHSHTASLSQSSLRRPSLVNQRAASFSDISAAPPLRLNTVRSMPTGRRGGPGSSSLSSSLSHSDLLLHASQSTAVLDSPLSTGSVAASSFSASIGTTTRATSSNGGAASTSSSHIPLPPPLRTSLESVGFPRLRSRSELDAGARADQIREARRKFEEREQAKAEKHDREMLRKRERRDHKEAKEIERQAAAQFRKNSGAGSDIIRPSLSRKTTPTLGSGSGSGSSGIGLGSGSGSGSRSGDNEKGRDSGRFGRQPSDATEKRLAFKSSNYDQMAGGTRPSFGPSVDGVAFSNARRSKTTKRKTQGYWNGFVLWLRTRLFRMGRN